VSLLSPDNTPSPQADAALTAALSAFDTPETVVEASNVLKANAAAQAAADLPEETEVNLEDVGEPEDAEEEAAEDDSPFAVEFEQEFGMKPSEAVALVQELQGFRQELSLMREWQVQPTEYDARMVQIKDFYGTLPEGERDKFNSVEGAKAIWNHLLKQGQATTPKQSTRRATRSVRQATAQAPKQELIKRSDILKMDEQTYMQQLPAITKAFREGRVVD
jgi:predicted metal-dependent peptidase